MLSKTLLLPPLLAVTAFASAGDTFTVDTSPRSSVSAALFPPLVVPPSVGAHPCKSSYKRLPPLREQEAIELGWIQKRMALVPRVLEKYGFDAYILSMREYAEDTIFRAFNPYTTIFSARRRTTYLFHTAAPSDEIPASPLLLIDNTPSLFATVNATLEMLDPRKIAVNVDRDLAFADGLHTGEGETLKANLGPKWSSRLDSERMIPVEISATRVGGAEQLGYYRNMQESVWAMIEEGFSDKVITPGETTTQDLIWWFRERMETMNVTTWFHPSVSVFRGDFATHPGQPFPSPDEGDETIYEGDMLHTDVGIYAMGMATDTQHLAYVLRANETDAPMSLKAGLAKSNRLQDIVRNTMKPGRTGDETLAKVRATFEAEELQGLIYCHPIGDFGHAAGTLIGMTNLQKSVPGSGQLPMLKDTWYSIELSAESFIPEWNRTQSFAQEEDVAWNEDTQTWEWVWGRQERFHLVRSSRHKKSGEKKHEGSWLVVKAAQKLGWTVGRWW